MVKYADKILVFVLLQLATALRSDNSIINQNWFAMQRGYNNLCDQLAADGRLSLEELYCHDFWLEMKEQLKGFILGPVQQNIVAHPVLAATMVRSALDLAGNYEASYLKNCTSPEVKALINKIEDTRFVDLPVVSQEFNCSAATLGHLFYAAKVIEQSRDKEIKTIVECGGGYGNLARIFKNMLPESTIFMVDLPELLAIQYFFLKSTLPDTEVIIHSRIPREYKEKAIHLIPVFLIENLTVNADVFISTFALSEAAEAVQNIISKKQFYNAQICYIQGQLAGTAHTWVRSQLLCDAIRSCYKTVFCNLSHVFVLNIPAYEIVGLNERIL